MHSRGNTHVCYGFVSLSNHHIKINYKEIIMWIMFCGCERRSKRYVFSLLKLSSSTSTILCWSITNLKQNSKDWNVHEKSYFYLWNIEFAMKLQRCSKSRWHLRILLRHSCNIRNFLMETGRKYFWKSQDSFQIITLVNTQQVVKSFSVISCV